MLVPLTDSCVNDVAAIYGEPPAALQTLRHIEGGEVGKTSANRNGTVDLGPFQINSSWVTTFATAWRRSEGETYTLLRDHGCANALAAGAVLRAAIDEAHGDVGVAIGFYHSHTPNLADGYRQQFLKALPRALSGGQK